MEDNITLSEQLGVESVEIKLNINNLQHKYSEYINNTWFYFIEKENVIIIHENNLHKIDSLF